MLTTWAARGVLGVSKEMADELVRQIDEHDIRPVIAKVNEFEDALDAFEALVATGLLVRLSSRFRLGMEDLDEWLAVELVSECIERAKVSRYIAQPTIDSRVSRLHVTI